MFDAAAEDDPDIYEQDASILRPYDFSAGEVAHYRLRLTLNDLGLAYNTVEDFLAKI